MTKIIIAKKISFTILLLNISNSALPGGCRLTEQQFFKVRFNSIAPGLQVIQTKEGLV